MTLVTTEKISKMIVILTTPLALTTPAKTTTPEKEVEQIITAMPETPLADQPLLLALKIVQDMSAVWQEIVNQKEQNQEKRFVAKEVGIKVSVPIVLSV